MIFERNKKRIRSRHPVRHRFARHILVGAGWLALIALVLVGVYHVTRIQSLLISEVSVEGGITISADGLRDDVMQELRGSYLRLIPYAFALTYPYDRIVARLESHPRLQAAVIERDGMNRLAISFTEYEPHALLCPRESTNEPCYVLDRTGYAFEETPQLQGGVLMRHVDETQERIVRGQQFDVNRMRSVEAFAGRVEEELGFRVRAVRYYDNGDMDFILNGGGILKTDSSEGLDEAFRDIYTVLETDVYAHLKPGNFQYIDVRFPPKVFVNEAPLLVATSTATTVSAIAATTTPLSATTTATTSNTFQPR
jgi:cell division septal protein FtsQ